jgi:hypothetical protein
MSLKATSTVSGSLFSSAPDFYVTPTTKKTRALLLASLFIPISAHSQDLGQAQPQCLETGQAVCVDVPPHSTGVLNALDGYCLHYVNSSAQTYFVPARSGSEMNAYLASGAVTDVVFTPTCSTPHCDVRVSGDGDLCTIGFP